MAINPLAQALLAGPGARYGMGLVRDPRIEGQEEFGRQAMMQGASTAPVQSPLEGLARALQAGVGGYFAHQAGQERGERERAALAELLRIGGMPQEQRQQALVGSENPDLARFAGPMLAQQAFAVPEQPSLPQGMRMGPNGPEWIPEYLEGRRQLAREGRPSVTVGGGVQIGSIPPGHVLRRGPNGELFMEQIQGSPAQVAQQRREAGERRQAGIVTEEIDRALAMVDRIPTWTTGPVGAALQGVPGTGARDLAGLLDTIEANIAFNTLSEMRAASPTGGALGSVTERELALLAATMGSVRQSQSAEQFRRNLQRLQQQFNEVVHGTGSGAAPVAPPSPVAPSGAAPTVPRGTPRAGDPLGILGAP